ncbi:MAG: hydrolase [Acidobacteria bacterium]|nr:hydrolase [Acidobacteriota bacterium]
MQKTVLCFGDSNTWGRSPHSTARHPPESRWPNVLAAALGPDVVVIAEGLNGRTTVWEDPIEEHRCGKAYLPGCLLSHHPLDVVVLMLGTNDLKRRFSVSAFDIGRSVGLLLDIILQSKTGPDGGAPQVLLASPPPVTKLSAFAEMFEGAAEKCTGLPRYYREHAEARGCRFFDAGSVVRASEADGLHLEASDQVRLGEALTPIVRAMLGG